MQLVSGQIGLLNPNDKTETIWTEEQVRAKAGVKPSQMVDWLSLTGDSVDNIPGVSGVGPKTAAELLNRFGSVNVVYEKLSEVKSEKLRSNLSAAEATVRRNQALVRLRDDLPAAFSPVELVERPADTGRLRELYRRWGFKTLLAALGEEAQVCQAILI
jgi:DNA polymerase-1